VTRTRKPPKIARVAAPRGAAPLAAALLAVTGTAHAEEAPPGVRKVAPARPIGLYLRAGGAVVSPLSSSGEMSLEGVDGPASLAIADGPISGSGASIDSTVIPAIIVGYVLPTASRRWSLETVLGTPFTVKFRATGTLASASLAPTALGLPTGVGPLGAELGEAEALPPIVTAVYRLVDDERFQPYVGAGASVMFALDPRITNPVLTAAGEPELSIAPAPGLVLQGGLDVRLWRRVHARLDVKFIGLMRARAEVRDIVVQTPDLPLYEQVEVGSATMDIWVNPFIVQLGVGIDL
jgi:outer membrane protein W